LIERLGLTAQTLFNPLINV